MTPDSLGPDGPGRPDVHRPEIAAHPARGARGPRSASRRTAPTRATDRVFREPEHSGPVVRIPAAALTYGRAVHRHRGRAVAYVESGPTGVRVRPIVRRGRVGLALTAAVLAAWRIARA